MSNVPYNKMVKAQLIEALVERDRTLARLQSRLAQLESDAQHRSLQRAAARTRADFALRREAAQRLCAELGVRSVTTAQIDDYLVEVAEAPWN